MAYKLLGWVVWKAARWFVRRRLGRLARPAVAAAVFGLVLAVAVALRGERS